MSIDYCCRLMENALTSELFPFGYDGNLREYQIMLSSEEGRGSAVMHYCPFCGVELPRSGRHLLFTNPSTSERQEVSKLTTEARSFKDILELLGTPTESCDVPPAGPHQQPSRQHIYSHIWSTMQVIFWEHADGTFEYSIGGKCSSRGH